MQPAILPEKFIKAMLAPGLAMRAIVEKIERITLFALETERGHEHADPIWRFDVDFAAGFEHAMNLAAEAHGVFKMLDDVHEQNRIEEAVRIRQVRGIQICFLILNEAGNQFRVEHIDAVKFEMPRGFAQFYTILTVAASQIKNALGALQAAKESSPRIEMKQELLCAFHHAAPVGLQRR